MFTTNEAFLDTAETTVEGNLGLVRLCAGRFKGRGIEYEELYSAGCMGLVKAVRAFDNSRGVRFSTYAVPVILGEIRRLFRDGGAVKVSRSLKERAMKISREAQMLEHMLGREPTINELAEATGLEAEEVSEAICVMQPVVSLTRETDEGSEVMDIPVEAPDIRITDSIALSQALEQLDDRDRGLICLRYFRNLTQQQTAEKLGMTQVQVSRREKKILLFLRQRME